MAAPLQTRSEDPPALPRVLVLCDCAQSKCPVGAELEAKHCSVLGGGGTHSAFAAVRYGPGVDAVLAFIESPRLDEARLIRAIRRHPGLERVPVLISSGGSKDAARYDDILALLAASLTDERR